jgi:hypothetical protein
VDKMTEFPFIPVRVSRSTFIPAEGSNPKDPSTFPEHLYSKVYSPDVPFQDVSLPDPQDFLAPTDSSLLAPLTWEEANVSLRAAIVPLTRQSAVTLPPKKMLPSVRRRPFIRPSHDLDRLVRMSEEILDPSTILFGEGESIEVPSEPELRVVDSPLEDWETADVNLTPVVSSVILPPIRNRSGQARQRASRAREMLNQGLIKRG